jgi:hypothetical protein
LTMKLTARSVSGQPGRRTDWNTGADAGASPRLANSRWETGPDGCQLASWQREIANGHKSAG